MTKSNLFINALLLTIIVVSGSCNLHTGTNTKTTVKVTGNRKFEPFNDVDNAKAKLSKVGIGQLSEWKENGNSTISSVTPYYQFGDASSNGMKNNLSYHLKSQSYHTIDTLTLVLSINNSLQKKEALKKFSEAIQSTFSQLSTDIPAGLLSAIDSSSNFKSDKDKFSTEIKLDELKIETWKFTIATK